MQTLNGTAVTSLVLRDATNPDLPATVRLLTAAFHSTAVMAWAEPEPDARNPLLQPYFDALLAHADDHGTIRVAALGDSIVGAAVWFPQPLPTAVTGVHDIGEPGDQTISLAVERLGLLNDALADRHPASRHQYLAYLAVDPARQNQGIGSLLLGEHHTRTPAYLEANDPRNRRLYLRYGFRDHGPAVTVAGSPPVYPMWRPSNDEPL